MQTVKSRVKKLYTAFRSELSSRIRKKSVYSPIKKSKRFGYDQLQMLEDMEISRPGYFSEDDNNYYCLVEMHYKRLLTEDSLFNDMNIL